MFKIKNKKLAKALIISSATVTAAAVGLGVTLYAIHSNEDVNLSTVYGNFLQGENLFKIYSPYIEVPQEQKDKITQAYQEAKNQWKDPNKKLRQKLDALDLAQEKAFNFYINHLNNLNLKDEEPSTFWNKIISNQEDRIRELDLKDALTQHKKDQSIKFFENLHNTNNSQKSEYLTNLSQEITKLVKQQNDALTPYIVLLEGTANMLDVLPFEGLKKDTTSSLSHLYSRIISTDVRLNEIQIASQDTSSEVEKLQLILNDSQNEINEINEYLKQIQPYVHNSAYNATEKQNIQKFLDSAKINLNLALTKANINQIRNSVVTFYEQISDSQKTVAEIQQVIRDLSAYVNNFNSTLSFNKDTLNLLILQVASINDKQKLISAKNNLFSDFYSLKFANSLIEELTTKTNEALENRIISKTKATLINSQLQSIVNKNLPVKQLVDQLFAFYSTQIKELEDLTYLNNELQLIQSQITEVKNFKFTSEDIQNQLNELNNQVIKTYSTNISTAYLKTVKNKLNETFRNILKSNLKELIPLLEHEVKILKTLNTQNNKTIIEEANKLNEQSLPITEDFNPIPSVEIIKQIKIYETKLQNLINANKQTHAEVFSSFTDDYLKVVFSNNDDTYVPTKNEQKRIDLYNKYKQNLDQIRNKVNSGSGDDKLEAEILDLDQKLKNLTNTANDFRKLSLLDKEALATLDEKKASPNANVFKPYINALEQAHAQLQGLFENPNATTKQIIAAQNKLEKAIKDLNEADLKILLSQKIAQLKTSIDTNYQSDLSSQGAKNLLKNYNLLLADSSNNLTPQEQRDAILKANQLINTTPFLYELEINKKRLLTIIGEHTSAPYTANKTNQTITTAQREIKSADELVARLNDLKNIPNEQSFENKKDELFKRGNEILLAYEQDKIEKINNHIQATKKTQANSANNNYVTTLGAVNNYALVQKSQLNYPKALLAAEKMDLLKNLADLSSQLLDLYTLYNQGATKVLSDYIETLLGNNDLSVSDEKDQISLKIETLSKAKEVIEAKKEFLEVEQKLNSILEENKDWKIYASLKRDISLVEQESNSLIYNNELSVAQIEIQKAQFEAKIKQYKTTKKDLLDAFNQAITKADAKETFLNNNATKLQSTNAGYSFGTYFSAVKNEYNKAKGANQKSIVDTNDINNFAIKLEIGYQKDLALNKLSDLQTIASSNTFGSSDLHTKIKKSFELFKNSAANNLTSNSLTLDGVNEINKKIVAFDKLFNLQKRIADYVTKNITQSNQQSTSIETLKADAEISLVVSSDSSNEIQEKHTSLYKTYLKEVEIQEIRENILATLENNDLTSGSYGIVKLLSNALGATYDTDIETKLNTFVNKVKTEATTITSKETLVTLLNKVNIIKDEVPSLAQLAISVNEAKSTLGSLQNSSSSLVNTYSQKLNEFITQAKENYFKDKPNNEENNIAFYTQLSDKITFTKEKSSNSDQLATKLFEIKTLINNSTFNLQSLNGTSGLDKLSKINAYLDSFEQAANNNQYNQEAINQIEILTQKANLFKNIIQTDQDVLTFTNTLLANNSSSSAHDLNDALSLVWDSIPQNETYSNSSLGKDTQNEYLVNDLFNLNPQSGKSVNQYQTLTNKIIQEINLKLSSIEAKSNYRNETNEKIILLKRTSFTPLVHDKLKNDLTAFLDTLENQNNTQNTLTISPNENGELNTIRNKVNIIQSNIDNLKTLAQKAYELNAYNNIIISNEPLVIDAKNQAKELINQANGYYNDAAKMALTDDNSIDNLIEKLTNMHFKLNLLNKYDAVKTKFDNDFTLTTDEKTVIQNKLNQFTNSYNTANANLQSLFNTYFRDVKDIQPGEGQGAKNSLIDYVLNNAINLQRQYNQALGFIALQDSNLDSAAVQTIFNQINSAISGASGVLATLTNNDNNEETKIQLLNTIKANINQLINAKKDQLTQQKNANDQIKRFFDTTSASINPNSSQSTYVDNFVTKGINDLDTAIQSKDSLSYSKVNVYLSNAKEVANLQIFALYSKTVNILENIQSTVLDYVNDFAPSKTIVRAASHLDNSLYQNIVTLKDSIDTALQLDFSNVNDYEQKISSLVNIINGNYRDILNNFSNSLKAKFAEKFEAQQGNSQGGFYVKLISQFDALKVNINGKSYNLFKDNNIEELENQYDTFKNQYESVNNIYQTLQNKNDSGSLANFAILVDKLNHSFLELEQAIKDTVSQTLSKNPLEPVFADLYSNIKYQTNSSDTDDIKNSFKSFKQSIESMSNNIRADNNFDFSTLNKNNDLNLNLANLVKKINEYNNWIKQESNKVLLLKQLEDDPNKTNPLQPIESGLDTTFDKKYKVIIAKNEITRKKFVNTINSLVTANATANTSQMLEIDNNDQFLDMFEQFAYTDKDIKDTSDLKSIFSPLKLKVYLKKYSPNGWFNLVTQTQDEVDRQSLKAKIVYSYESNNTNIGELKIEKEVVITFKTLDTIAIPNETSSIFINNNQAGINTKVEVLDVDEAGWNIPQVANANANNATQVKNDVITKVYNKMKAAIFNLNTQNSNFSSGIITPNNTYLTDLNSSTDPSLQNVRYSTETSSNNTTTNRLSAYLDKNNRNIQRKYGFDFENQLAIPITYNVSLTSNKDFEILNIIPKDNDKGFAFLQLNGGFITGLPGYGGNSGSGQPGTYEEIFVHQRQGHANIYNDPYFWYKTPPNRLPTGLNLNLYNFNIDYDVVTRKVYFYNSWTENTLFVFNKGSLKQNLDNYKTNSSLKNSDQVFLTEFSGHFGRNVVNYQPKPIELAEAFSIFASFDSKIFRPNISPNNWLPTTKNDAFGGFPVFPINGGQSTVYRTDPTNPNSAILRPLPPKDWQSSGNQLNKATARNSLTSALVNEFWFKIR
ncbi:hypothetical protein NPA08_02575 [Mycoplasmopsis citelli]|uniref:hypothetical protein n=1 Tax=Mycoplasmopsis citelli TaxID=171281 RepID=UPI00211513A9|nr:hypothetical protein [Mycoplasmopsis citelli]UUD35830.1 hypothetical protein NPA08_02575 [Mycoplasmopsis citelli]